MNQGLFVSQIGATRGGGPKKPRRGAWDRFKDGALTAAKHPEMTACGLVATYCLAKSPPAGGSARMAVENIGLTALVAGLLAATRETRIRLDFGITNVDRAVSTALSTTGLVAGGSMMLSGNTMGGFMVAVGGMIAPFAYKLAKKVATLPAKVASAWQKASIFASSGAIVAGIYGLTESVKCAQLERFLHECPESGSTFDKFRVTLGAAITVLGCWLLGSTIADVSHNMKKTNSL